MTRGAIMDGGIVGLTTGDASIGVAQHARAVSRA
jgi:hypothetical protein